MSEHQVPVKKHQSLRAVKTLADGTQLNLGLISYYHKNPIINFFGNMWVRINSILNRKKRLMT